MGFALRDPRLVDDDLRRLVREQYERAGVALSERKVHRARTSCKRARAAILLIGPKDSDPALDELVERTRGLAAAVGGRRDAHVMIRAIEKLASRQRGCDAGAVIARLALIVGPHAEVDWDRLIEEARGLADRAGRLDQGKGGVLELAGRGYGRARRRVPESVDAPDEAFHRWRTACKTHWYQMRILRPLSPSTIGPRSRELRKLTEWQGKHHDLAVLLDRLREHRGDDCVDRMTAAAVDRQQVLARKALRLGRRLFSEKRSCFVGSLEELAKAWGKR